MKKHYIVAAFDDIIVCKDVYIVTVETGDTFSYYFLETELTDDDDIFDYIFEQTGYEADDAMEISKSDFTTLKNYAIVEHAMRNQKLN